MTLIAAEKKSLSSFAVTIDDTVSYCGRFSLKEEERRRRGRQGFCRSCLSRSGYLQYEICGRYNTDRERDEMVYSPTWFRPVNRTSYPSCREEERVGAGVM
jgi:hypothetical protein